MLATGFASTLKQSKTKKQKKERRRKAQQRAMRINHIPQGESNQCAPIRRFSQLLFSFVSSTYRAFFLFYLFFSCACLSVPFSLFTNVLLMATCCVVPLQLVGLARHRFRLKKKIRARYGETQYVAIVSRWDL
ncbi:hypothetical protein COCSADRAFT_259201 [Bipolaris sorokiniana ND90Pr]|uniref:Transmembrane protein n=1 Tax=Cochliobolus sativus (strain ND90Pr / ATCC 201652) TaxID=665912 RepID=M2SQU7_COCSN|nr:uncharacterized protein COCSADRAFT_259201 [Bipolaris sorokiniana ND90Pr]EMD59486.1 hypothetical protein COCSADRAFT_259201 [Bipolaris sorokiniana ND90Pr]